MTWTFGPCDEGGHVFAQSGDQADKFRAEYFRMADAARRSFGRGQCAPEEAISGVVESRFRDPDLNYDGIREA